MRGTYKLYSVPRMYVCIFNQTSGIVYQQESTFLTHLYWHSLQHQIYVFTNSVTSPVPVPNTTSHAHTTLKTDFILRFTALSLGHLPDPSASFIQRNSQLWTWTIATGPCVACMTATFPFKPPTCISSNPSKPCMERSSSPQPTLKHKVLPRTNGVRLYFLRALLRRI